MEPKISINHFNFEVNRNDYSSVSDDKIQQIVDNELKKLVDNVIHALKFEQVFEEFKNEIRLNIYKNITSMIYDNDTEKKFNMLKNFDNDDLLLLKKRLLQTILSDSIFPVK